jgi:AraC-like DNA-binding protein
MGKLLWLQGRLEEMAQSANYDSNTLAHIYGVSTRQLQRHFRRRFHCPPQHWLNDCRMAKAKQMLVAGESVKKVAIDLGFKHTSHFCRQFKCRNHMTPSQFALSQTNNVAQV